MMLARIGGLFIRQVGLCIKGWRRQGRVYVPKIVPYEPACEILLPSYFLCITKSKIHAEMYALR